jgi:hypothetical protein
MPIEYKKNVAVFVDVVPVEEAERLLSWVQERRNAKVNLSACSHMHPANLQVLMASKCAVAAWPNDPSFCAMLMAALEN